MDWPTERFESTLVTWTSFKPSEGPDEIYPDGVSINEAIRQLDELAE
jgi:hypothetical protein